MNNLLLITTFLLISLSSIAQDFSFGKTSKNDFQNKHIDTNANAVVLNEFGLARIELPPNNINGLQLTYSYHVKILILKKNGFEEGNFSIPLYGEVSNRERLEGIKGITYNLVDDKIVETELEKKSILTTRSSDNLEITKIALPNIQEGSIIELKYTVTSPYLYNLQSWEFQKFIPKNRSQFITEIPEMCVYNINMKGGHPLTARNSAPYNTNIFTDIGEMRGTRTSYLMENIPAFISEDYMTAAKNFMSTLTFELARYSIPFGPSHNFTTTWKDVEKQLSEADNFGGELKKKGLFKEIIPQIAKPSMSETDKAQAIYAYIKKQIKWDKSNGLFADKGIKKALEERNGNVADINLALITALRAANIAAYPVILSTRNNGYPSISHPMLSNYNYVIGLVKIDSSEYFVDASEAYNPFGQIPHRCINLQGRIILENGSDFIPLKASLKSSVIYEFLGDIKEDGSLTGNLSISRNGFDALHKRNEIKASNSFEEYFEKTDEKHPNFALSNHKVENLDSLDFLLKESYNIRIDKFAHVNPNSISLNPIFIGRTEKNPFNLDERNYPVDLGSAIEESFDLTFKLPNGYKLSEKPKNTNMALPDRDAKYIYSIREIEDNQINIQILSAVNKDFFLAEEYSNLKEFFSRIIQSQKIDLKLVKQ